MRESLYARLYGSTGQGKLSSGAWRRTEAARLQRMGAEDLRRKSIRMRKYAAALVGALALCSVASATIIPSLPVVSTMLGVSTYSYTLTLSVGEEVVSGDDFCFADVLGLTGTPTAPTGWTATDQPSSACPHIAGVVNPNSAPSVL